MLNFNKVKKKSSKILASLKTELTSLTGKNLPSEMCLKPSNMFVCLHAKYKLERRKIHYVQLDDGSFSPVATTKRISQKKTSEKHLKKNDDGMESKMGEKLEHSSVI